MKASRILLLTLVGLLFGIGVAAAQQQERVTLKSSPAQAGRVIFTSSIQTFEEGAKVYIRATPSDARKYQFMRFTASDPTVKFTEIKHSHTEFYFSMPKDDVTVTAHFASKHTVDNWIYVITDPGDGVRPSTAEVVGCVDNFKGGDIPSVVTIEGGNYTVTGIGYNAFNYNTKFEQVNLPATIRYIDDYAFANCTKLTKVGLAENSELQRIGRNAFFGVAKISEFDFSRCKNLTSLEYYAFNYTALTTLDLTPCTLLQSVGQGCFGNVNTLEFVLLPATLSKLEEEVFTGCTNLRYVHILNPNMTGPVFMPQLAAAPATLDQELVTLIPYTYLENTYQLQLKGKEGRVEFPLPENEKYVINIGQHLHQLTATALPSEGGTLEGIPADEPVQGYEGQCFNVTAKAAEGYDFLYWTRSDHVAMPDSASPTVNCRIPNGDVTLTAHFQFLVNGVKYLPLTQPEGMQPGTVRISSNQKYAGTFVEIPAQITVGGKVYDVTEMADAAFYDSPLLEGVDLSRCHNLRSIGEIAFADCPKLQYLDLSGCTSLTAVGLRLFEGAPTHTVILPKQLTQVPDDFFNYYVAQRQLTFLNPATEVNLSFFFQSYQAAAGQQVVALSNIEGSSMSMLTLTHQPGRTTLQPVNPSQHGPLTIAVGGYALDIPEAGHTTFAAAANFVMPEGLQAGRVVKENGEAKIAYTYQQGDVVVGGQAVLIKGQPGEYFLPATDKASKVSRAPVQNDLTPCFYGGAVKQAEQSKGYMLSAHEGGALGFYLQSGHAEGQLFDLFGQGYLELPAEQASSGLPLVVEDAPTAIENILAGSDAPAVIFTLTGQRLHLPIDKLPKGIYLINGQKVLVK